MTAAECSLFPSLHSADPLGSDVALPLKRRYYPMGFPLDVATNSAGILLSADFLWSASPAATTGRDAKAVLLHVAVDSRRAQVRPVPHSPRGQRHLVSFIHGPDNFAICDLAQGFAWAMLTQDVALDHGYVNYHFLEPAGALLIDAMYLTPVHASCVALGGRAILLCGDSGSGKTSLAYACARRGWTYLSDDATHIIRAHGGYRVTGRPQRIRFRESARLLFPELNAFTAILRPSGKRDFEIDPKDLEIAATLEAQASHIVFLRRKDAGHATFETFPRSEAFRRLGTVICYGDESVRAEQTASLKRFIELPVLQLTYASLDDAELQLRSLADGRPCH